MTLNFENALESCEKAKEALGDAEKLKYLKEAQKIIGDNIFILEAPPRYCKICGKRILAKRSDATTCGDTCKKRKYRIGLKQKQKSPAD